MNRGNREIDAESEICSVIIPPPLPPVQSHAVLEKSLGIPIPRTPARTPKFSTTSTGSTTSGGSMPAPPLPTRTSSKLVSQRKYHVSKNQSFISKSMRVLPVYKIENQN